MPKDFKLPNGAKLLQADGKGGTGNVLLLFDEQDPPRVLKVYRTRRSRFRELLRTFSQVVLEGKTGSRPRDRFETEQTLQTVWKEAGLDVIEVIDAPVPAEIADPALWLEYLPRPDLQDVLKDPATTPGRRAELLNTLGQATCLREKLAVEENRPGLIHEHATLNHFFVDDDRLVAFDLENGFQQTFPVRDAVVQELSTLLRSISRLNPSASTQDLEAFLNGYEDKDFLGHHLEHGIAAPGLRRKLKRWYDQKTRPGKSKTDVMKRVRDLLPAD